MKKIRRITAMLAAGAVMLSCISFTGSVSAAEEKKAEAKTAQTETAQTMPVEVKAKAAVLMDVTTGKVLMAKNENERLPPASVTKIMTLLLVCEAIDSGELSLTEKLTASKDAVSKGGSQIWLKEGESMTVDELLKAAAIASANDACAVLAERIAGSEEGFVTMMNERAKALGMKNTNFENCTGLDDTTTNHYTSAYDIAIMGRELLKHDVIQNYTTVWMDSLRDGKTELVNTNKLVRFYKGTTGLKTGTTQKAGHCLAASAQRDSLHLIAVVLGCESSDDRFNGAKAMLNWGFSNWVSYKPEISKDLITDVNVLHGIKSSITPEIPETSGTIIKKGAMGDVKQEINIPVDVEAPVEKGQVIGTVTFTLGDEKIGEYNLTAGEAIKKIGFLDALAMLLRGAA